MNAAVAQEKKRKLAWRCRRGTRELDRMTQHYLERHYDGADAAHRRAFEALLQLPDPQLHDVLTGRASGGDTADEIARLIRDHCGN